MLTSFARKNEQSTTDFNFRLTNVENFYNVLRPRSPVSSNGNITTNGYNRIYSLSLTHTHSLSVSAINQFYQLICLCISYIYNVVVACYSFFFFRYAMQYITNVWEYWMDGWMWYIACSLSKYARRFSVFIYE